MRLPSVTVFVLNVAIIDRTKRTPAHYQALFKAMRKLNYPIQPVKYKGTDTELYFGFVAPELEENDRFIRGYIDRAINVTNRDWYNSLRREPASDEELEKISFPQGLVAAHREFTFLFDLHLHRMFVDNRDRNSTLAPAQAQALFAALASAPAIFKKFGSVTVKVRKSREDLDKLLNSRLKALSITVRLDNGDLPGSSLRDQMLEQIAAANAAEATFAVAAEGKGRLKINEETRELAQYAVDGAGEVEAKVEEDGLIKKRNLSRHPLEASEKYDPRKEDRFAGFRRAVDTALKRMRR